MSTTDTTASNPNPGADSGTTDTTQTNLASQGAPAAVPDPEDQTKQGGAPDPTSGSKPEGDGGKAEPSKDEQAPAVPEQYEAFQLPEGFTLEGERLSKATEFFKANGWTQEKAQEAINLYTQLAQEDAGLMQAALQQQVQQRITEWGEQAKAELGDKYDEAVGLARTAVTAVGNEALTAAFEEHGWGNHPELIKAFAFFGKFVRDSSVDTGDAASATAGPQSMAERMYANAVDMTKKHG